MGKKKLREKREEQEIEVHPAPASEEAVSREISG